MTKIVRFKVEHYGLVLAQGSTNPFDISDKLKSLEDAKFSYTIFSGDRAVSCGGLYEYWDGRAEAWIIFAKNIRHDFLAVFRVARKFFDDCSVRRIEATVACDSAQGHRWLRALGFQLEAARMPKYYPDGSDGSLYARVRE